MQGNNGTKGLPTQALSWKSRKRRELCVLFAPRTPSPELLVWRVQAVKQLRTTRPYFMPPVVGRTRVTRLHVEVRA